MVRELHVVAVSEDGRHVVLATSKGDPPRPEFTLVMDDRLKAAIRGDLPRLGEREAPQSAVTPKEIQARLRAGESVEQIAAAAGVPAARVERFAGPVLSEREVMVAGARAAVLARPRRGLSALPLGDAVAEHLQDMSGYKADSTTWSARREESGRWLVQVSFVARAKQRTAGWRYDPATKEVVPVDAWSAAIAHADVPASRRVSADGPRPRRQVSPSVVPGRSIAAAPPVLVEAASPPARRPAAARAAAPARGPRRAAAPAAVVARAAVAGRPAASVKVAARTTAAPAGPGTTATPEGGVTRPARPDATVPAAADHAAVPKAPASAAPRRKAQAPVADVAAADASGARTDQAPDRAVARASAVKGPARPEVPAVPETASVPEAAATQAPAATVAQDDDRPAGPPTLRVVPSPVPDATAGPPAPAEEQPDPAPATRPAAREAQRPAARRAAGGRASVPVWADVLLGTAPVRPARDDRD